MIEINLDQAIETLRRANTDLSEAQFHRATRLAINDSLRKARTVFTELVLENYDNSGVNRTGVRQATTLQNAIGNNLTGRMFLSGKPIPITYFKHSQTKAGISVEIIKGQRKTIRSAFKVQLRGKGKLQVMARGQYESNKFSFRKKRAVKTGPDLPINKLLTTSLPAMLGSKQVDIYNPLAERVEEHFLARIEHYMKQIRTGGINPISPKL